MYIKGPQFIMMEVLKSIMDRRLDGKRDRSTSPLNFFRVEGVINCLFVCFVALCPKSPAIVMAGQSVHLTTLFPGQA